MEMNLNKNKFKKISFVAQVGSTAYFKNMFSEEYSILVNHKELVTNQYAMVYYQVDQE